MNESETSPPAAAEQQRLPTSTEIRARIRDRTWPAVLDDLIESYGPEILDQLPRLKVRPRPAPEPGPPRRPAWADDTDETLVAQVESIGQLADRLDDVPMLNAVLRVLDAADADLDHDGGDERSRARLARFVQNPAPGDHRRTLMYARWRSTSGWTDLPEPPPPPHVEVEG